MAKNSTAGAIVSALRAVTKDWAKQRKAEERHASAVRNRRERLTKFRPITIKEAAWRAMQRAYLTASANGTLPATATQVMYAARNEIQQRTGRQLDRQYFNQTLLPQYLAETNVSWDIVFDDRGHFTEPHKGKTFGLGTLAVRNYLRSSGAPIWTEPTVSAGGIATCGPQCRFGAVLFIEKEGFIPLFERVQLAERYDIAIMSTKGMSVTACRQLVEAMCASNVPLLVLHDFDKSGFSILGTLRSNTRRYSFRSRPNVIDLGLRLDDVTEFEDQAEDTFDVGTVTKRRENLRKNGATEAEIEFILHRRIELNALRSDQLIAFVERRLAEHGIRKIIPDKEILAREYRAKIRGREIEKIFAEMAEQDDSIEVPSDLQERVADHLKNNPAWSWDAAVCQIVFDDERHERD